MKLRSLMFSAECRKNFNLVLEGSKRTKVYVKTLPCYEKQRIERACRDIIKVFRS